VSAHAERLTPQRAGQRHAADAGGPVLLVVAGGTVTQAAIARAAELAGGDPVTVIGVGQGPVSRTQAGFTPAPAGPGSCDPEQVRRAVALAMSVLENAGIVALGLVASPGPPARTIARVARARGARVVILDQPCALGTPELRRRMYGSGVVVLDAAERGNRWVISS
jgi:xanthine/CO dehydrogenase XdhC/CoxF family maturation factor